MHSKQKGNLGFSAVIKELHKLNYNVFTELGDYSKIDMIVEKDGKLAKIQAKYLKQHNGFATLNLQKSGPNGYRYIYTENDVDIFACYLPELDKVIFIPSILACKNKKTFTVRFQQSKNEQKNGIHSLEEFLDLNSILQSYLKGS